MKKIFFGIISLLLFYPFQSNSVSFDCSKAKSFAEKTICSDDGLSNQDNGLKIYYDQAKISATDPKAFTAIAKDLWDMRERCQDKDCIEHWYIQAIIIYRSFIITEPVSHKSKQRTEDTSSEIQHTPIEARHVIYDSSESGLKQMDAAVALTRNQGFKCDSVSAFRPMITSPHNFFLECDHFAYAYDIKDMGGNWVVSIDE
ncbi:hypothetical protein MKU92_000007 [Salmonella enterica]|nr:hypothetical protein [Salmonella enterica]EKS4617656.1 hypothetical protein [Salmonella enterica]